MGSYIRKILTVNMIYSHEKAKEKQKDSGNIRSYRNPFCFLFIHLFFDSAPYQIVNTYVIIICQSDQPFDRNVT